MTAGAYALGLAVLVVALSAGLFERSKRLVVLGLGGVAGAVISYGPWVLSCRPASETHFPLTSMMFFCRNRPTPIALLILAMQPMVCGNFWQRRG